MTKKNVFGVLKTSAAISLALIVIAPAIYVLLGATTGTSHIQIMLDEYKSGILHYAPARFLFENKSLSGFAELFASRRHAVSLLHTIVYAFLAMFAQLLVSLPIGFFFAKWKFKGREIIVNFFIFAMILPFQVTLVPNYIMFRALGILDTYWCLVLPGMFSPFGVYLFYQFNRQVPDDLIYAARIDGASTTRLLVSVVAPNIASGIAAFGVVSFIIEWSKVAPALSFIRDMDKQPLSIVLRETMQLTPEKIFAPSVVYMLPPLLAYIVFASKIHDGFRIVPKN